MMFITGDCHGEWRKFSTESFPEQREMTKDDYVIVTGDFGIWDNSEREKWWFDWMEKKNFTILFVDGNHENFDLLNNYPVSNWKGGKVHFIRPNVIHLMRGEVYEIDGYTFYTFGGANSHDISDGILELNDPSLKEKIKKLNRKGKYKYRVNHESWWKEEMPSKEEMDYGIENLKKHNYKINFIISHDCPSSIMELLDRYTDDYEIDDLTEYFETISNITDFNIWFFGHHHEDKKLNNKFICLYDQIVKLY